MGDRLKKQKTIAENRAPVFARPSAQPASTPTGWNETSSSKVNNGKESWPGTYLSF
jgi:hypothetical protein